MLLQQGGTSLPGWRDFERTIAAFLGGIAPEGKAVFDVLIPSPTRERTMFGISVKSKEVKAKRVNGKTVFERSHLEISNASAQFWQALNSQGILENDFREMLHAETVGTTLVELVNSWYTSSATNHLGLPQGYNIDIESSVHTAISYTKDLGGGCRDYQIHSYKIYLPSDLDWRYLSSKCVRGYDRNDDSTPIIEWYGGSGGQLKYYPPISMALYCSPIFQLEKIDQHMHIHEKAARYWPTEWKEAGGSLEMSSTRLASELVTAIRFFTDPHDRETLLNAAKIIRNLI